MWQTKETMSKNSKITKLGLIQSRYLNNYIKNVINIHAPTTIIYSSPLKRAVQTVSGLGKKFILDSELIEAKFHVANYLPRFNSPHIYKKKLSKKIQYCQFKLKVKSALNRIISSNKYHNILLYTHGGVIKTILRIIHDNDGVCYTINNCSITQVTWKGARWHINDLNNISFIPKKYIT